MASGDVFANMYLPIAGGSTVAVQPAAGVSVVITCITGGGPGVARIRGTNAAGSTADLKTAIVEYQISIWNMKLFINNSQYITLIPDGAAVDYAYSGIEL